MHGIDQLCRAIETNDLGLASELLATQRDLADSIEGTPPPIHWAIFHDKRRMVELLLEYGADIERRDQDRNATPLEYAIVYARTTIIPILVSWGADVEGMVGLAIKGASGEFDEFSELPSREVYLRVAEQLRDLGANT